MKLISYLKMKNILFCIASFALIFLIMSSGCDHKKNEKSANPMEAPKEPTIVAAKVLKQTVPEFAEYVATIDPSTSAEKVEVRARVEAELVGQHFEEGRLVKRGDLLFTLDDSTFRTSLNSAIAAYNKAKADLEYAKGQVDVTRAKANLDSAEAQLALANTNLNRIKPLAEQKAVPQQDYDNAVTNQQVAKYNVSANKAIYDTTVLQQKVYIQQAQAEMENAQANIDKARINLGYCTITAPISGMAGTRLVAPGNLVGRGEATLLTTITNLDPLRVNFSAAENDYLALMEKKKKTDKNGKASGALPALELYLSDNKKYHHTGKISISDQVFDSKTGTMLLVGVFPNPDNLLRPGMFGRIRFVMDYRKDALLIPQKAVMVIQDSKTVYVVEKDNSVTLRSVKIDGTYKNLFIVSEGLKANEVVVVEGQLKIHAGIKVKPVFKAITSEQGVK